MADDAADLSGLVHCIYDAVLRPGEWPEVMKAIAQASGGCAAVLQVADLRTRSLLALRASGIEPEMVQDYNSYYGRIDPRVPASRAAGTGVLVDDGAVFDERGMDRHEFYADFLAKYGFRYFTGLEMAAEAGTQVSFAIHREPGHGIATPAQRRIIRELAPHIDRALRTALALDDLQAERDGLNEPLDRLGIAAFVIARDGRVCWMNRAAESMLRAADGITIRHGRVVAMHPRLAPRLDTLLSHVLATAAGTVMGGSAQVLRIARPSGKRDYELSASPLQHSDLGAFVGGTRILLLVRDPDGDVAPNEQLLRELYGLSPQEAVLARCLAEGLTVEEAAARLGTTINTTRVYLRRIFRKTETDRQVDLLRLLLRVLPR